VIYAGNLKSATATVSILQKLEKDTTRGFFPCFKRATALTTLGMTVRHRLSNMLVKTWGTQHNGLLIVSLALRDCIKNLKRMEAWNSQRLYVIMT
jgi:hypothetical protein